jgi:cytochrome P450 / NADPH-cytochrome P450 reductase
MQSTVQQLRVPQPRPRPIVGNVPDVGMETPVQNMMKLAQQHGPLFKLQFPTFELLVVSSAELVNELCDETRFDKYVHGPLKHIRAFAGDGLFTADTQMPNWGKAHRILMPAFGPGAVKNYFAPMLDVADQLVTKWARQGDRVDLDVADNMTRLTLDTIALCGFGYRFNSFYQREMHPFVDAMVRALGEAGARTRRLPLQTQLNLISRLSYGADIHYMNTVVDQLIRERKEGATTSTNDLLSLMLSGRDPQTGEGLDDLNIRNQMVTFLIAGHETTSGLLSFALYELMQHPALLAKARDEVDRVLGGETPRFEHLAKLTFLDMFLRETLRLWPTAPAFALTPKQPTRFAGVSIKPGDELLVLVPSLHRDRAVWGDDAETFDPERFALGKRELIPPNAWKPFGNGQRACIGRPFAMQEATLVLAMVLQRFELLPNPSYQFKVKETLTLKPDGLTMRVRERTSRPTTAKRTATAPEAPVVTPTAAAHGTPLRVLYGSNSGTCEAFARRLAGDASARGYAVTVSSMDEATGALPTDGALVVVTASYNGTPPDNARRFCQWVDGLNEGALAGLRFSVFGCGNRDWATTYQAVPTRVDAALARAGATRLLPRGEADARADFFGDFEQWYATATHTLDAQFKVAQRAEVGALYSVKTLETPAPDFARAPGFSWATVLENRELVDLSSPMGRSKRHLAVQLPTGLTYRAGESLAVVAENPPAQVERVARRFQLSLDTVVQLETSRRAGAFLPIAQPMTLRALLSSHVELGQPATRRQLEQLIAVTRCPPDLQRLQPLVDEASYRSKVLEARVTLLDLLEDCPSAALSFADFLELLPASKPRLYSISSSPLANAQQCTLTVSVVKAPAWSGRGTFQGVASTWLAERAVGDRLLVAVKAPSLPFQLPEQAETPVIMIGAGSGLAPFRGFVEERALKLAAGETLGPAMLFFGCDHPDVDFLYRDELAAWERAGAVQVFPAFFRAPIDEVTFVQHRLWRERAAVADLLARGAKVFICGDGAKMAPAVRATLEQLLPAGGSVAQLEAQGRLVADVFS